MTHSPVELKPCPWCNTTDLLRPERIKPDDFLRVVCRRCGVIGPSTLADKDYEAIAVWNRRAEPKREGRMDEKIKCPVCGSLDTDNAALVNAINPNLKYCLVCETVWDQSKRVYPKEEVEEP